MNSEAKLRADERIERLLKNPNWKPAAEAAIAFLYHGTDCPITSWKKSSTWAQVKMVYGELNREDNPKMMPHSALDSVSTAASHQESPMPRAGEFSAIQSTGQWANSVPSGGHTEHLSLWEFAGRQQALSSRILCFLCAKDYRDVHVEEADHNLLKEEYSGGNRHLLTRWSVSSSHVSRLARVLVVNGQELEEFLRTHGFNESHTYKPDAGRRERWFRGWKHVLPPPTGLK